MSDNSHFWLQNPSILFNKNNFYKIIPMENMPKSQKLNALTRLVIYIMILYLIFSTNYKYIYLFIVVIIILIIINYLPDEKRMIDTFTSDAIKTDDSNPHKNVTMENLMDIDNDEISNINIKLQKYFNDIDDSTYGNFFERQIYTMPSTTIPNDQTGFAKWLYTLPETCKENQKYCLKYENLKYTK